MATDETYLEAFIDSISTLPSELRRNLTHLKSLDQSYRSIVHELRGLEEDYISRAYDIIQDIPIHQVRKKLKVENDIKPSTDTESSDSVNIKNDDTCSIPTNNSNSANSNNDSCKNNSDTILYNHQNHDLFSGVLVEKQSGGETVLVIPTTEELRKAIEDPEALYNIAKLRRDAREYTEEKLAAADQAYSFIDAAVKRLDADLEKFESVLKGSGQFETSGAQPDDLAAIQVVPNSPDWILAKVISHDIQTGMYKLSDEDIESNKTFTLPESQVVILGGVDRLSKGDIIYAVYPDTTSFYQATVVQVPRKVSNGESFVMVNFKDDGDEHGITHDKAVLMKYIMRVPYGAIQ